MLLTIASFELRKRLGMISTYVYFALFFALAVLAMLTVGGAFNDVAAGAGTEKVLANAPVMVQAFLDTIAIAGVLVSAAVFGQAVHQDFENQCDAIIFTKPISKASYLGGRFLGALVFMTGVLASIGLGMLLVSVLPFGVQRSVFGPTRLAPFIWPYVTMVVPNLAFTGAMFFALGALGRRMMPVYIGAVVLVLGYVAAGTIAQDVENRVLGSLLDPFGENAVDQVTRYWTTADKNTLLVPLSGVLLANRAVWLAVGAIIFAFTYTRFQLAHHGTQEKSPAEKAPAKTKSEAVKGVQLPQVVLGHSPWRELFRLSWLGFTETVKNTYFVVIVLAGGILAMMVVHLAGRIEGTSTWPVTYRVAEAAAGGFGLITIILITFYAGEIVWRERDARADQITDALPVPIWIPYLSKLVSLWMMLAVLRFSLVLFGIGYQTVMGYHHHQLGLYLAILGLRLPTFMMLTVLAVGVHSVLQNKYVSHAAMVAYYLFGIFQDRLGLEHQMFHFMDYPRVVYSDMNGFGHGLRPLFWYDLYWAGFTLLLGVGGALMWQRGTEVSWKMRVALARARFGRGAMALSVAGLALFVGAGGVIFYNTCILNHYLTGKQQEALRADYEKKYKSLENAPQPRITDVVADFDISPETETLEAHGHYTLENKTDKPIDAVYVRLPPEQPIEKLSIGEVQQPTERDFAIGFYTYKLPKPMQPGEKLPLEYRLRFHDEGFKESGNRTDIAGNGTFFNSENLPHLGYDPDGELEKDNVRKKYDLPPKERMKDLNDPTGLQNNLISYDADWITFESTVSTSPDQIAIAPGYLDREWNENGRHYFHFKMDSKILDFYSVLSGRYQVRHDEWNGVKLEVYYHPDHTYDIDDMIRGMKESLAYASQNFGPYQHRQARIIEFPRYEMFAQSFPNTIPYSEAIGFIARVDLDKPDDVDYPVFITSHEIGHQWWAHQVIGGKVQGVSMLDETLAEYTGMMVMKKIFKPGQMRRFLKYELDQYLRGRAFEDKKELPLERVENQQYIHYYKGGVVMFALQDYIGEDKVNQALASFLSKTKLQGPPYPKSTQLVDEFKAVAPPEMQYLIHDLFEAITLYDNRALSASAKKRADGKYDVTVKVSTKKMQADDQGKESDVAMDDLIDIGAVDEKGEPLFLEKRRLKAGESEQTFVCDKLPTKAGIDPFDKLVDRHPDDNTIAVTE